MSNSFGASRRSGRPFRGGESSGGLDAAVRAEARMRMLTANLPDFAKNNPTLVAQLAQAPTDDVAMMQDALGAFGTTGLTAMKTQLSKASPEMQQGQYASMNPLLRDALTQAGWTPATPESKEDGYGITDFLGMDKVKAVGSGAKYLGGKALAGLAWGTEEIGRVARAGPLAVSQGQLQQETGMNADQLLAERGIDTTRAAQGDGLNIPVIGPLVALAENPGDVWAGVRTWNEIGHHGRDDFLATKQNDAYELLEDEFPGQGKDLLRFAKALIDGDSIEDIAENEGFGPGELQQFKDTFAVAQASEPFREAMNLLETGRVSYGRNVTRWLFNDPDRNVDEGPDKIISGSVDLTFQLAADPTLALGKLSKAVRAVRWATNAAEGAGDVTRWQDLSKVWDNALNEVGGDTDRAELLIRSTGVFDDVATKTAGSKMPDFRVGDRTTRLIAEARAVHAPARAVADAFATKDWDSLVRKYPAMQRSIRDMQFFDAALREAGDHGLDDVAQVFEFYKWTAGQRSILDTLGVVKVPQATKLFGHEGTGKLMIPHSTGMQRARLATRTAFANFKDGVRPANAEELAALREAAEAATGGVDDALEIDPETLLWVTKESGPVRKMVRELMVLASTKVPRSPVVMTGEQAVGVEEFRKWNDTMGIIGKVPRAVVRARFNQYVNANAGLRHAMGNKIIFDTLEATGMAGSDVGAEILRKHIANNNHIYGFDDLTGTGLVDEGRSAEILAHKALFESQTAEAFSVPTFKDWLVATRKLNALRWVAGGVRKSHAEAAMTHVWKPGVLLRFGFPLRAGGEEALSFMLREGVRPYLRQKLLVPWAGVREDTGELALGVNGLPLQAPTGAFKPFRFVTDAFAHIAGVSDRALAEGAEIQARRHIEWTVAPHNRRAEILTEAQQAILGDLPPLPKSIRKVDEFAKWLAVTSSNAVHEAARGREYLTRAGLAKKILEKDPDFAKRQASLRHMIQHPTVQAAIAQGNGFAMGRAASQFDDTKVLFESTVDIADPNSPSGVRALRLDRRGPYGWVGHQDLGLLSHHWNQNLRQIRTSKSGAAVLRSYESFVSQTEIDEITKAFGGDGLDGVIAARESYAALKDDAEDLLEALEVEELADLDVAQAPPFLQKLASLSQGSQELITASLNEDMLTTSMDLVNDRAALNAYNALRRLDNSKDVRGMVAASSVDGKRANVPLKAGHTRIYVPTVDRRLAGDLVDLLSNPARAEAFADRLVKGLRRVSSAREAEHIFDAVTPQDLATWAAGMKATLAQTGANRIPAGLAGTSNMQVAVALRDTIADLLPGGVLKPTLGFIDHPDDLFLPAFGVQKVKGSLSVVRLDAHQAADMTMLDPTDLQRLVRIKVPGPEGHTRWVSPDEVDGVAGLVGRVRGYRQRYSSKSRTFAKVHDDGVVVVNQGLIDADFKAGMEFLAGNGGTMRVTAGRYSWADPADALEADKMIGALERAGLNDTTDLDFWKLIGHYRRSRGNSVPFTDEMIDARLWDKFSELAERAKPGTREVSESWTDDAVAVQSRIAGEAMKRLGANLKTAGRPRKGATTARPITKATYAKLLTERAKAHEVLRAAGERPPLTVTEEAIQREMDALSLAWVETGLTPTPAMINRPAKGEGPAVLGEIWASGFTEEAAVRRAAQAAAAEVRRAVFGAKSKQPMREVISPLLRNEFSADKVIRTVPLEEIPGAYGPREVAKLPNSFARGVARGFDVIDPAIAALARDPMFADGFHKSMTHFEPVRQRLIDTVAASKAQDQLRSIGLNPEMFTPVDDFLMAQLRVNKDFPGDDPLTAYARALMKKDGNEEVLGELTKLATSGMEFANAAARDKAMAAITADIASKVDVDALRAYHLNLSHAREAQVQRAATRTWEMVAPYIDDHSDRSAFQEFLGPVFLPFFYAEEQFIRRFARGVYETPHMIRRAQLMMNGLETMGVVREDETTGKRMMVIPGSDVFLETVASVAALVTGNDAYRVDVGPLGMNVDYVLPGWNITESRFGPGPLISLVTDTVVDRYPEMEWAGRRNYKHWWEALVPTSASRAYQLVAADPTEVLSSEQSAIGFLEATGHGLDPDATASQKTEYLENVRSTGRAISVIKFTTGLGFFGALAPLDEQAPFRREFSELLGQGVSIEAATEAMIERHGPGGLVWTIFGSDNQVGAPLPPTAAAFEFMLDNEELMADHPETMAWFIPQSDSDETFDHRAYNEQLALGLRTKRTPEQFIDQIRLAGAMPEYFKVTRERREERKAMTERGATAAEKNAFDLETSAWKRGFLAMNPLVEESFNPDAHERRLKVLETMPTLIAGGAAGEMGEILGPLVQSYNAFRLEYDAYAGRSSKQAKAIKEALAEQFYTDATLYVRDNPQAGPFFRSVIEHELPDAALPDEKDGT